MGRISRTVEMAGASWRVLKADKELMILPLVSLLAIAAVAWSFMRPLLRSCTSEGCVVRLGEVILFGMMFVTIAFTIAFFNAALVHAANERMSGGDPGLGTAIRGALMRVHRIFPWAIVVTTVAVILSSIKERAPWLADILGVSFSLVTFLVIPVLVFEDVGVGQAMRRSGVLFKKTWGENVIAQLGFGLLGFLLMLPGFAITAFGISQGGSIAAVLVTAGVAGILIVVSILSALSGIFQTALYRYASGASASAFPDAVMASAFVPKRGRGGSTGMPEGRADDEVKEWWTELD